MICATEGEMTQVCGFLDGCKTKYLWAKVRDAVAQTLDAMTLAELANASSDQVQNVASHFVALSDIHVGPTVTGFYLAKEGESRLRPLS